MPIWEGLAHCHCWEEVRCLLMSSSELLADSNLLLMAKNRSLLWEVLAWSVFSELLLVGPFDKSDLALDLLGGNALLTLGLGVDVLRNWVIHCNL